MSSHALAGFAQNGEDFEEPSEDDLTTEDHSRFYQYGKLVLTVPPDASSKAMWRRIDAWMTREKFYPNVWFISDHGNAHLMTRE